jgi:RNA polymerase sigma-70 factor (ECF subfamily)
MTTRREPRRNRRHVTPVGDCDGLLVRSRTDPERFGDFFDGHYDEVLTYFAVRVRSPETAADLCAETFAAVLAGIARFDPAQGSESQWLYGIARNLLYRYWRDLRVQSNARDDLGMASSELDDDTAAMIARVDASARRSAMAIALDQLPVNLRRAVEMRVLSELDYTEIAEQLGCRPGAARVRVHRGLRRLRSVMEEDNGG